MRLPKLDNAATTAILAASAIAVAGAFLLTSRWAGGASGLTPATVAEAPTPEPAEPPIVDVVFALDTTGSMSGLIESAKEKIWSVANQIVTAQPRPQVRFGLVFYRDKSDDYVTRHVELTDDIDEVYDRLLAATAGGGGDTPEHVNAALDQAINHMQWRDGEKVLRLVFLVGDAPPHDDYTDGPTSTELAAQAATKGIVINTIRAGHDTKTEMAWRLISAAANGAYASIAQDGGTVAVATPYDEELGRYNSALAGSSIGWGSATFRARGAVKARNRHAMKGEVAASAASVAATKGGYIGTEDLVSAYDTGKVKLEELEGDAAPEEIRGKSVEDKKKWIAEKKAERAEIAAKIKDLSTKRRAFLKKNKTKKADSFDDNVGDMLRDQAEAVGLAIE